MHDETLYDEKFTKRLIELRMKKGVSARDMSLSIGQNPGYINNIESGRALPSMANFFYICEFLEISPKEFFDFDSDSERTNHDADRLYSSMKKLTPSQFRNIQEIICDLACSK